MMFLRLPTALLLYLLHVPSFASVSPKRGLVYIGNTEDAAGDSTVWSTNTDLTWYYNYALQPVQQLRRSSLHFVPMLWGHPDEDDDTTFVDSIRARVRSGENITHVLAFNEPDMERDVGGSDISPADAAEVWQRQLEPLRELGIKVGAPAVSGSPIGYAWLKKWEDECDRNCNPDFMPIHWYGIYEGLAGWIANMSITYPEHELWVTEFGLINANLEDTHVFYNQSIDLLDRTSNVTRYAYFGAVRSDDSNTGPSAAMLTEDGELTDIGSWYLGGNATGAVPDGAAALTISPGLPLLGLTLTTLLFFALG